MKRIGCSIQRAVRGAIFFILVGVQVVTLQHQQFVLLMIMPVRSSVIMPSLGLFLFKLTPYIDASISGHMGETRDERIAEFVN